MRSLRQVRQKGPPVGTIVAKRQPEGKGEQQNSDRVIPIKKFETPALFCQLLRIGPRPPAEHRDDAEHHRPSITGQNEHLRSCELPLSQLICNSSSSCHLQVAPLALVGAGPAPAFLLLVMPPAG